METQGRAEPFRNHCHLSRQSCKQRCPVRERVPQVHGGAACCYPGARSSRTRAARVTTAANRCLGRSIRRPQSSHAHCQVGKSSLPKQQVAVMRPGRREPEACPLPAPGSSGCLSTTNLHFLSIFSTRSHMPTLPCYCNCGWRRRIPGTIGPANSQEPQPPGAGGRAVSRRPHHLEIESLLLFRNTTDFQ